MDKNATPEGELRIDREGRWFHEGVEITHERTLTLFSRSLTRDASGGYWVEVGRERAPVVVEDTPYVIRRIEEATTAEGVIEGFNVWLNDSTSETLDMGSLEVGAEDVLYCSVKSGAFRARFLRPPYYHLVEYLEEDPDSGGFCVKIGERRYPIVMAE